MLVSAAVMTSALSFALCLPDLYRATAIVLVERPIPEAFVRSAVNGELDSRLHVIKQEILSRDRLTDLVTRFNLYPELRARAPMDSVLDQMRRDIEIELNGPEQVSGRKTTVSFKLSYTGASGKTVADVTNALSAFYVAQNASIRSEGATRTTEFLREQLNATRKQLDQHEREMRAYTSSHHGELPQQVDVNLAALERLNTQLRLNGERQFKLLEDREKLTDGLTITLDAATGKRTATADTGPDRIERMKHSLQLLESQYNSRYPDVVRLKAEIAIAEREREDGLAARTRSEPRGRGPEGRRRSGRRATQDAGRRGSRRSSGSRRTKPLCGRRSPTWSSASKRCRSANRNSRASTRDHQASKGLYDSLLKKLDEAQLGENLETDRHGEQFRVLEDALPPSAPVAPNRQRLVILGLIARGGRRRRRRAGRRAVRRDVPRRGGSARPSRKSRFLPAFRKSRPGIRIGCCARSWRRFRLSRWSRSSRPCRFTPHGATKKSCGCWCAARNDFEGLPCLPRSSTGVWSV